MTTQPSRHAIVELSTAESWGLLREQLVGRLAVLANDHPHPEIFPVNYIVDHGSIVFRTAEGTKLARAIAQPVAFEVDNYDPSTGEAWSVVIKGTAREVKQLYEVLDALDLPLFPWHAAPKARIVRIEPEVISGRRFHVLDRSATPKPGRRASPE